MLDFGYYNLDCMVGMKEFPDKYFDLAIVDPPYGGGGTEFKRSDKSRFGGRFDRYGKDITNKDGQEEITRWDIAPTEEYFNELFRVSKRQIIWGGNYFSLPPTRCFLIWRKLTISEQFSMAMCEYAWTNFNDNAKLFECSPQGRANEKRFHPTQKPVALYEWILSRYAKDGDIILDTHVGSASSLIACHRTNHKFVGFELDEYYYQKSKERLENEMAQMTIYDFM